MSTKKPTLHKGLELEKNFKVTTVEVDKDQLINELAMGAAELSPHIKGMTKKQLQRVLEVLLYAPICEPPVTKIKDETEALMVINFLRLQDLKIALVELMDEEVGTTSDQADDAAATD